MTSFVDLMANDIWSEADIQNRQRAAVASVVPEARQQELQTILLGHLAGMRVATPEELAEIGLVKDTTLAAYAETTAARADMALLQGALDVEAAQRRLALAPVEGDEAERAQAQAVIAGASAEVLDLVVLRAPSPDPQPEAPQP